MRGGKFEVGIVSMLQTALNGRPGATQFLREVCRLGGGRGEGCPLQTALNGRPGALGRGESWNG